MAATPPLITALINSYNYARYLPFSINSVLSQTYPNIEILVIDDGSTDHTPLVARQYGDRIKYVRTENGGQGHAFNVGLALARGELVMMLDADDIWLPEKVERMALLAAKHPEAGMMYHQFLNVDPYGNKFGDPIPPSPLSGNYRERYFEAGGHFWCPVTSTQTLRTQHIRKALPLPTYAVREGADNIITDYSVLTAPVASISEVLTLRLLHGSNLYAAGRDNSWYRSKEIREGDVRRIEWRMFLLQKMMERLNLPFKVDLSRNEWRMTNLYWLNRASAWSLFRACMSNKEHSLIARLKRFRLFKRLKSLYRDQQ